MGVGDPDAARCPLCGQANACALALPSDERPGECWCVSRRFPPELLAQATPKACICRSCLERGGPPSDA